MNLVFFLLAFTAFAVAAASELGGTGGAMEGLAQATLKAAEGAVPLALGLVGVMALFLGLMKVAEAGGLLTATARLLSPLLRRLFPEVPADHPAMGAMVMNVAANVLGLGNAATPFGIRAMEQLETLNPRKGVASNAQVLFLAINTASVTILPTSVIALRASVGSADPAAVVAPTLLATLASMVVAVAAARLLQGRFPLTGAAVTPEPTRTEGAALPPYPAWAGMLALAALVALIPLMIVHGKSLGHWIVPGLVVGLLGFGLLRRVAIYETFVEGAKEGFAIGVRIIPYLVAILVAVGMFRASGAMDMLLRPLGTLTAPLGVPAEALAMAAMRSLSGSGSFGLLASYMKDPAIGPDGYVGVLLGTIYGSSETTFYVLAVYFGAVGIRRIRHALAVGLIADVAGLVAAVLVCLALTS
ncbi:MAG TPA: nucleoside recognition domain-containing protein [Candidatus Omnitrophota bacterium]|nr:nucleoside recognition domain-containing protein [Candidatus Omnitrophota bacterium]